MGSSISVPLAELTMQSIEEDIFDKAPCQIHIWKRYVDDAIAIIPDDSSSIFLNFINSLNPHIQFTIDREENNQLAYLDLLLRKETDGRITFQIFRKPTHTDRYLDFNSNHPNCQKRSVARSLLQRADRLCSQEHAQEE